MADDIAGRPYSGNILVMGIGNLLMGDDGLGVHAIRKLENQELPDDVQLLDAGTAFLDAVFHIPDIPELRKLIIIDAIKGGKETGTVYRLQVTPDSYTRYSTSIHGLSVMDMIKLVYGVLPETVSILGIEPHVIDWTMELSNTVSEAMPLLIDVVFNEIVPVHE